MSYGQGTRYQDWPNVGQVPTSGPVSRAQKDGLYGEGKCSRELMVRFPDERGYWCGNTKE